MMEADPGRRAAQYWFIDGLPELVFGVALLAFGVAPVLLRAVDGSWGRGAFVASQLLLFVVLLWDRRMIGWVKARLTYPRTGYVPAPGTANAAWNDFSSRLTLRTPKPFSTNTTWFPNHTVGTMCLGGCVAYFWYSPVAVPVVMIVLAVALWALNRSSEHPYSVASLAPLAISGIPFFWIPMDGLIRSPLPMLLEGVWLSVRGLVALLRYLRENPRPEVLPQ